ncbi:dynamin family protein [Phocaeicola sartorii]|uniref:dynamin family protein n=1 Tax=Phocaeicola sartorii TaxID=671267 RepID=UPI0035158D84
MNKKDILETITSASQLITKMRKVEIIKSDDEIRLVNDLSDVLLNLTSPLTVTVIGPFNSGKSTFINAIIEERILPENINPSTSMVCKIGYCNSHLKIQYIEKGNILVKEISIKELKEFVDRNSSNYIPRTGDVLEIFHNNIFCEKDIVIVDTPGFNDPYMDDEETNNALNKADAVIYCMHISQANSRLDAEKIEYLQKKGITSIFFAIGFSDLLQNVDEEECDTLKFRLRKELASKSILHEDGVFFVSAAEELNRIEQKKTVLNDAGFDNVRKKIWEFLQTNRIPIKNEIACNKIGKVREELEKFIREKIETLQNSQHVCLQKKEQLKNNETETKACIAEITQICSSYEEDAYKFIKIQIETEILSVDSKIEEWVDEVFAPNFSMFTLGLKDNATKTIETIQRKCTERINAALERRIVPYLNSASDKLQKEIKHTVEKYIINIELDTNCKINLPALRLKMEEHYNALFPEIAPFSIAATMVMMERNMIPLIGMTFAPLIGIIIAILGLGFFQYNQKKKRIISSIREHLHSYEFSSKCTQAIKDNIHWKEDVRPSISNLEGMIERCIEEQKKITNLQNKIETKMQEVNSLKKEMVLVFDKINT